MASTTPPFTVALRFCGSCCVTLAYWAVWLVLGATLVTLAYVAAARELPVPDFVLRRAEAELAKADLAIKFGRARFDPTGKILLEDVQVRSRRFEEPLLICRLIYVRCDFWLVLSGRLVPDEIRIEGGALQLPAMLSPSGTVEPLVRDLALTLRHEDKFWLVDQGTGRIGRLAVTAEGRLTPPAHTPGARAPTPEEIVGRFLQVSRQLALDVHRLDAFEEPALALQLESPEGVGNLAHLLLTAAGAQHPWDQPVSLGPLAVTGSVRLDGKEPRPVRLHVAARQAAYRDDYQVENVRAILAAQVQPENFSVHPLEAMLAAGALVVEGETILGPVLHANLAGWPEVHATTAAQIDGEFIGAEVEARLAEESARIRADGRGSADFISRILAKHTPRAAPYFVFGDPVIFKAEAVLAPGWKFATLSARVDAGRIDSHGVKITAARGRIDINGTSFLAHDAQVTLGENLARGSYWMDFATTDYRMLLQGRLRPPEINGWFHGDWWLDFWNSHFTFPVVPPEGDVDVQGRWRDAAYTTYFGRGDTRAAMVLGTDFEDAHTLIFLRPNFTHALELGATRAGGAQRVAGTFRRLGDPVTRETVRLDFSIDSNLDPAVYRKMADGRADALLDSLQFTQLPQVHAQGAIEGKWPGATPNYTFTGHAEGGLHYFGFPVETARVTGGVTGADVRLDDIQFTTAGGRGAGKAALSGPPDYRRLGFDLYLNGADLARTIRAVEEYQAARTGQKSESVTESKFLKRASGGRLDVALSAQGEPGNIASFTGTGNASLTGTELGEIHLFGLLSQMLSGLSLNFSSVKLDAARTSFRLEAGRLNFPDLKITGPTSVIDARGNYAFATNALDFTAKFKPYEENRNIFTLPFSLVINPITSMLELKLTGPLSKPDWSIVVGGSGSHPELPAAVPKVPAATPPDAAKPAAPKS